MTRDPNGVLMYGESRKSGCRCCNFTCYRNSLVLLNILYVAVACTLIGLAMYGKTWTAIMNISVFGGIIACGVFLLIIALVGLAGVLLHHQVTLFFYMVVLILLFILQFSVACACLAMTQAQQEEFFDRAWTTSPDSMRADIQLKLNCCAKSKALQNSTSFNSTAPCNVSGVLPDCCNASKSFACTGNRDAAGSEEDCGCPSCWDKIKDDVQHALLGAGVVGLLFSFTEIMGVWLASRYRNQKDPSANPHDFL